MHTLIQDLQDTSNSCLGSFHHLKYSVCIKLQTQRSAHNICEKKSLLPDILNIVSSLSAALLPPPPSQHTHTPYLYDGAELEVQRSL